MDSTIAVLASFHATPEGRSQLVRELQGLAIAAEHNPACQDFRLTQALDDPARLIVIERWIDAASHDDHLASATIRDFLAATESLLQTEIAVTRTESLR